jgi:exosortase/archaeosortase family protein
LAKRSPLERTILILAVAPVALLSSAIRIVVFGLLMQRGADEAAARFSHNSSGWLMIAVAAVLFGLLAAWLQRLIVPAAVESGQRFLKRPATI